MSLNDHIINTALLGTAAKELPVSEFPVELQDSFRELKEKAQDPESAFYQMAALSLAYSRAGMRPSHLENPTVIPEAEEDEPPYFSQETSEMLLFLVANRNRHLLSYAYRQATRHVKLILPCHLQPLLVNAFDRNNPCRHDEQRWLSQLTGKRGRWLLPLMGLPIWGAKDSITWETASHEERKRLLVETRREDPDAGLALLRTELKNESASHREELIQCLRERLNANDEAFLQDVATTDRSTNVKETARQLLCALPDSQQVRYYWELLRGKLHYNMLLGWSYDKIAFTPEMKKMGLTEISTVKNEKDDRFLLRQLAERVPLGFWCEFYYCEPEKAARKLAKNPPFQELFAYWIPIALFGDSLWAYHTLKERKDEEALDSLIALLPSAQREEISFQPNQKDMYIPDTWYDKDGERWGIYFSIRVFQRLLTRTYYVSKEEAERAVVYFHPDIIQTIEKKRASLGEQDSTAARTCQLLLDYIMLKQRIDATFNHFTDL